MADGLIQDQMAQPEGQSLTPESVQQNIKMPPELQEAYERVVIAGMKVMFSKESHSLMLKELQREGPVAQKLGNGIAGLMLMLFQESNQTMPPQVMIPAGIELMMQAADFLRQAGLEKITDKDIGDAMEIMITTLLQKFGASPEQIQKLVGQYDNTAVDQAAQQMGGGAPAQPAAPQAEPGMEV